MFILLDIPVYPDWFPEEMESMCLDFSLKLFSWMFLNAGGLFQFEFQCG